MRIVYFLPGPMSRGPLGPEELVRRQAFLNEHAFHGTEAVVRETENGPASVESSAEEYLSVPGILEAAPRLEAEGFDAMIIGCFGDPGLAPARELVDFPVIGPGQAGALAAAQMGQRFAIITVVDEVVPAIRRQMRGYGLEGLVADIRAVDVPVLELRQRADQVLETLELEAHAALRAGADTLVLGCMTMGFPRRGAEARRAPRRARHQPRARRAQGGGIVRRHRRAAVPARLSPAPQGLIAPVTVG